MAKLLRFRFIPHIMLIFVKSCFGHTVFSSKDNSEGQMIG